MAIFTEPYNISFSTRADTTVVFIGILTVTLVDFFVKKDISNI